MTACSRLFIDVMNILPLIVTIHQLMLHMQDQIAQALTLFNATNTQPAVLAQADAFLRQCETQPGFAEALLDIYARSGDSQLQLKALILLTNVIKRNWLEKAIIQMNLLSSDNKSQLRVKFIQAYGLHGLAHAKHYNELLIFLAKVDYPQRFSQLHDLLLNSLQLVRNNANTNSLTNQQISAIFSTVRAVTSQISIRNSNYSEEQFTQYVSQLVGECLAISQQLHGEFRVNLDLQNSEALKIILNRLRDIDASILQGLYCIPSSYQVRQEIVGLINWIINQVQTIQASLQRAGNAKEQMELYVAEMLTLITKLQSHLPILFHSFLQQYQHFQLKLLLQRLPLYSSEALIFSVINANFRSLGIIAYSLDSKQFLRSPFAKRYDSNMLALQVECNNIFKQIYTSIAGQLLQSVVTETMIIPLVAENKGDLMDDPILEDMEVIIVEQLSEPTPYELCLSLCRSIVRIFPVQSYPTVMKLASAVPSWKQGQNKQILTNIMEMLLILPQVSKQQHLPVNQLISILQILYSTQEFHYLSRIIRRYHSFLPPSALVPSFTILARVVASPPSYHITPDTLFQAALGLKSLLMNKESQLPIELLNGCITNLISVMLQNQYISNPNLLWPMIGLLYRLVRPLNQSQIAQPSLLLLRGIVPLLRLNNSQEMVVSALAELIATLTSLCLLPLARTSGLIEQPIQTELILVLLEGGQILLRSNLENNNLQNFDCLYSMWLTLMQHYPSPIQQAQLGLQNIQLGRQFLTLFQTYYEQLNEENSVVLLQLTEEYVLTGLLTIDANKLCEIAHSAVTSLADSDRQRALFALSSLYLTYGLQQGPIEDLLVFLMGELFALRHHFSPLVMAARTQIILAINWHFLAAGIAQTFTILTKNFPASSWLQALTYSSQFLSNKFAYKLNMAVFARSIDEIGANSYGHLALQPFEGNDSMTWLLKVIHTYLGPLAFRQVIGYYTQLAKNVQPQENQDKTLVFVNRRVHHQLNHPSIRTFIELDITTPVAQKLQTLLNQINWDITDVSERVGGEDQLQISKLLGWVAP